MKSTFKRIIIVFGVILILLIICLVSYGIKANTAMKRMTSIETGEVINNIYVINDSYVNLFLIKGNNKYVAIDSGNKVENINIGLKSLGINSDDIIVDEILKLVRIYNMINSSSRSITNERIAERRDFQLFIDEYDRRHSTSSSVCPNVWHRSGTP